MASVTNTASTVSTSTAAQPTVVVSAELQALVDKVVAVMTDFYKNRYSDSMAEGEMDLFKEKAKTVETFKAQMKIQLQNVDRAEKTEDRDDEIEKIPVNYVETRDRLGVLLREAVRTLELGPVLKIMKELKAN